MEGVMETMDEQIPLTPEVLVPRLGEYLVERGLISEDDLQRALLYQNSIRGKRDQLLLGQILVSLNIIDRSSLDHAITEQILQLRTALIEANEQLEERVKERTTELEQALKSLSELNQLKSNFIANISHELRTPLTHIKGYLELFSDGNLGPLSEAQTNALKVLKRSSERLEIQVEDLIHFASASRGEFTIQIAPFNLEQLFEDIHQRYRTKVDEKQIDLQISIPPRHLSIMADLEKISWVLIQLMDNAIKFTSPGGRVTLSAEIEQSIVRISVRDTGIGIPEARFNEIFEPFHQLDGSTTRRYGGAGLGLALVRQIIEAHGSKILVKSTVGKGTTFSFSLAVIE